MTYVSILAPLMAPVSRMAGGGWPTLPWGLDQWLYAIPYALVVMPFAPWWATLIVYGCAVVGKRTGHGRGFNYNLPMKPGSKPEKVEHLILWLYGRIPLPCYKALIMALTGVAVPLGAAIVCAAYGHWWACASLIVSGFLKGVAYLATTTEEAEEWTGAFGGLGIAAADFLI